MDQKLVRQLLAACEAIATVGQPGGLSLPTVREIARAVLSNVEAENKGLR